MRKLEIHSFVWTDGKTQSGLEKTAREHGCKTMEFAYLKPERFDLDKLLKNNL